MAPHRFPVAARSDPKNSGLMPVGTPSIAFISKVLLVFWKRRSESRRFTGLLDIALHCFRSTTCLNIAKQRFTWSPSESVTSFYTPSVTF